MDFEERLGIRIRYIRQHKNMTQQEVADGAKVRRAYLGELERGKYAARIDTLHEIAKSLNVSLSEMFEGIE